MEKIRQLAERGLFSGIVFAAVLAGFAGFLYVLYRLLMRMRPKAVRQEEQRIRSHRLYKVSGRGRAAYLILCLEQALQFYEQELTAWEGLLRKIWSITDDPRDGWIDHWLDSVGELLPSMVITNSSDRSLSEEAGKAQALYAQAGNAMIVINVIIDSMYTMVGQWSPNTDLHDPDALYYIEKAEETMEQFHVPLPSGEVIQLLLSEQKDPSFGKPFDGLRFSGLSKKM